MEYIKMSCQLSADVEEMRDVVIALLCDLGFDSFEETADGVEAYIPENDFQYEAILEELKQYDFFPTLTTQWEKMENKNWNEEWEKHYFQPVIIGNDCVIKSPHHTNVPQAKYEILIEPKMSFGTGHHETTSLIVEMMLKLDVAGKRVLDMGCGTGILGLLAGMMGAKEVVGIDIDEWAYNNSIENCERNGVKMQVMQGGAELLTPELGVFDLIWANINRNILLEDMKFYAPVLKQGGNIIMSGFYDVDLLSIQAEAERVGFKMQHHLEKNKWIAVIFEKQ